MGVVKELLQDVEIPKFYKVANKMDDTHIEDVAQAVRDALKREGTLDRIKPGSTVCFTAASREIANSVLILRTFAEELKRIGATPYIVPAMGSHGGATARVSVPFWNTMALRKRPAAARSMLPWKPRRWACLPRDWMCGWMPLHSPATTSCLWPGSSPIRTSTAPLKAAS